jgi:hypothetical protein
MTSSAHRHWEELSGTRRFCSANPSVFNGRTEELANPTSPIDALRSLKSKSVMAVVDQMQNTLRSDFDLRRFLATFLIARLAGQVPQQSP